MDVKTKLAVSAAQRVLEALIAAPRRRDPLVRDLWVAYNTRHVLRRLAPSGQIIAKYSWNNLGLHFGHLTARQVTQGQVDDYEDARLGGAIGKPSKSVTVRREIAYLRACLNYGARMKLISKDDVEVLVLPADSPPRQRWLTIDEIQKLLDAAAGMRLSDCRLTRCERFMWIGVQTGARKAAILNLEWSRVDFETGTVDFRDPRQPATRKRRAVVPMSASLRLVLDRAWRERTGRYVLDNTYDGIWSSMQIVASKAGFSDQKIRKGQCPRGTGISPHTLRHSAATLMARAGVPLFHVAGILANSLPVTEAVYAHHAPADPSNTVDQISQDRLHLPE